MKQCLCVCHSAEDMEYQQEIKLLVSPLLSPLFPIKPLFCVYSVLS